jgi:hypothetical protein
MVTVRTTDQRVLHEQVARHLGNRPQDPLVSDATTLQLFDDHASAREIVASAILAVREYHTPSKKKRAEFAR